MKGDIFSKTWNYSELPDKYKTENMKEIEIDHKENIDPPWSKYEENKKTEDENYFTVQEPEYLDDLDIKLHDTKNPFSHSLSYTFSPSFTSATTLDSSSWDDPDDINFEKHYDTFRSYGNLNINYTADYFEDLAALDNYVILSYDYKTA